MRGLDHFSFLRQTISPSFFQSKQFSRQLTTQQPPLMLPSKTGIQIKHMTKEELGMVMGWAKKEGWNPVKHAVEAYYATDPGGYRLLTVNGEPVASLFGVRHSQRFAFLGGYIVCKERRGEGLGMHLWNETMSAIADCSTIGLNGVMDQVENYKKSGFSPAALNTQYKGQVVRQTEADNTASGIRISFTQNYTLSQVIDYDARVFYGIPREAFLSRWVRMPETSTLVAMDGGAVKGYGVITAAQEDYKIAPLFADNEVIAEEIFIRLSRCVPDKSIVHLDTTRSNPSGAKLAKRFGLMPVFDTLRMYKGESINEKLEESVYSQASLEIG